MLQLRLAGEFVLNAKYAQFIDRKAYTQPARAWISWGPTIFRLLFIHATETESKIGGSNDKTKQKQCDFCHDVSVFHRRVDVCNGVGILLFRLAVRSSAPVRLCAFRSDFDRLFCSLPSRQPWADFRSIWNSFQAFCHEKLLIIKRRIANLVLAIFFRAVFSCRVVFVIAAYRE